VLHENAHEGADETQGKVRITRGMPVVSETLGLSGICDVVEFRADGGGVLKVEISELREEASETAQAPPKGNFKSRISDLKSTTQAVPVEYKRGKPKAHRADEVQLCAQAICLEEMLGIHIASGALYYGEKRRRTEVVFDEVLRNLVISTIAEIRECFASGITPLADYESRRCDNCSLIEQCQPMALRFKKGAAAWFSAKMKSQI
jgi:CRISPR-associated exonuclease Cas4